MVIAIFGESCTGKSTLAEALKSPLKAAVYTGKDYLRLCRSPEDSQRQFRQLLAAHVRGPEHLIYVLSETELLSLLPEGCLRVLVTAELPDIEARFARRMGGALPPPVAAMLRRKHGCFDSEPHDLHIHTGETGVETACQAVLARIR